MNPVKGSRITTQFDEMRPLSVPPAKRDHVHGALDLAGGDGIIRAPARGTAQGAVIVRGIDPQKGIGTWGSLGAAEKSEIMEFPWREYWYDIFGGIVVLYEPSGRMHIMAHIWASALLNHQVHPVQSPFRFSYYIEERETTRWPCHMMLTEPVEVQKGQPLSKIGNAGFSTGPHLHWEVHHTHERIDDYAKRVNPEEYL